MVTDAMTKEELEQLKASKTTLASSETSALADKPEKPKRGRKKSTE